MPFVSVIIPNYNHAVFLNQRIESVLTQTYRNFEVIILDDCSTDESRSIIQSFISKDARFNFISNNENSGSTFKQWNKGVELAESDLIWIAESDDVADPAFLQQALPHFKNDPSVVLVYCQSNRINATGQNVGSWKDYADDLDQSLFASDFKMDGFLKRQNTDSPGKHSPKEINR